MPDPGQRPNHHAAGPGTPVTAPTDPATGPADPPPGSPTTVAGAPRPPERLYDERFDIEHEQSEPYQNGFTWRSALGAAFVATVMMPGIIFMSLSIGQDMGSAADWVTVILFMEVCRRAFVQLRKQELYLLKYTVSHLTHATVLGGGVFAALVHNRYLANSVEFHSFGLTDEVPSWFSPIGDPAFLAGFLSAVWLPAVGVIVLAAVLMKLSQISLGFLAFKLCNDVDRLPFPMAPVAAQGATALAEYSADDGRKQKGYRQYCFAVALILGAVFGLFYIALPTLTANFLPQPIKLIPIPFLDLTVDLERLFPGGMLAFSLNLAVLFLGFVLPWRVVIGSTVAAAATNLVASPLLQRFGLLPTWAPGKDAIETHIATSVDVYISVGIGLALAVAALGLWSAVKAFRKSPGGHSSMSRFWARDVARGDPPTWLMLGLFLGASLLFVVLCHWLVPAFPVWLFALFAFLWTPLNTYINARMSAITGQHANFPYVFESSVLLSGYARSDVWLAPLPLGNYGSMSDNYKETELTRTRFTSLFKAELLVFPLLLLSSFLFWSYICGLGPVPGDMYPHAEKIWPQQAQMKALWASTLSEGGGQMLHALKPLVIGGALAVGLAAFGSFGALGISTQYLYGAIGGISGMPTATLGIFAGALLGRYVLAKRFGRERWQSYTPVLLAGFTAGVGLIGMISIAVTFLVSSVAGAGY